MRDCDSDVIDARFDRLKRQIVFFFFGLLGFVFFFFWVQVIIPDSRDRAGQGRVGRDLREGGIG